MSSMFDQALRDTRLPTSDDLEIFFPTRREAKERDAGEVGAPGEHGGASAAPAEAGVDHTDAAGSTNASEPLPQRDDPDDGEHTDSTQEQITSRAAKGLPEVADEDEQGGEEPEAPESPQTGAAAISSGAGRRKRVPRTLADVLANTVGSSPVTFNRVAFNANGNADSLSLVKFPNALVEELRRRLAPTTGGAFAENISATALVSASLIAHLGIEMDLDENTAAAADAFRQDSPRLAGMEDKLDETLENIDQLGGALKLALERLGQTGRIVDGLEFAAAYLVADRVASVTTSETTEHSVDVTQKKVLVTRDRIKASAKAQRTIEKQREERSNA